MFQSTPPHGGRPPVKYTLQPIKRFNPRPRMGGDHVRWRGWLYCSVSIHAPAWGATRYTLPTESL